MPTSRAPRPVRRPTEATQPPVAAPGTQAQETICLPVPIARYRVLFADGALVDFLAYADHSGIREQMLDAHYGKRSQASKHNDPTYRIEGVAHLGQEYVYTPQVQTQDQA